MKLLEIMSGCGGLIPSKKTTFRVIRQFLIDILWGRAAVIYKTMARREGSLMPSYIKLGLISGFIYK